MEDIKRKILYCGITFVISFTLGILFDHYVLYRSTSVENPEVKGEKEELEIVVESEETQSQTSSQESKIEPKIPSQEPKVVPPKIPSQEQGCTLYVDISGALKNSGVYCLEDGSLVIDAVNKAGGFSKEASIDFIHRTINLAQPLVNNQKLYFPKREELVCELKPLLDEGKNISITYNEPVTQLPTTEPYIDQNPPPTEPYIDQNPPPSNPPDTTDPTNNEGSECVNINTATKEELMTLNGVGESTAEKIIMGRPYTQIEDLLNVSGIGEATLAKFEDMICI
jgi:competence protein ComEA